MEWQGRSQDPERSNRRDVTERGRDMGRVRGYSGEDRGTGRGRDEYRGRSRAGGGGGMRRGGFSDEDVGRYGRGYEYGGDEDRGRFDQDSREEYRRGGLMRGTAGHRRAGGPGDEFGEGFWNYEPPRVQSSYLEQRPRTGYATSPTRDMDREMGHGAGRGGMQGAYPYDEQSPELPRRQGRGPRSYQRSDDRIREDICDRLMQGWMDADDVTVRVEKGEVTLSGMVKSREEKRAIEDLAEEVLGVKEVNNELRVAREPQREEDRGTRQDRGDRQLHS
ncbi:BON domain-containing protein [Archangium lansingense]|uniref:BON domain-containing protein n=1 Tax=Archangium lansingense TaxID=2995310 RepID=A0ABT4A1G1_9BACT|nr:BON domain-containing protein [Archangium lansinium]MCY1075482.1 BON domain-containing protein [Archangium lansinium]